ncbi:MAG: hypothetical protein EAZ36_02575 [Verrucomicrobia bacterium]|nr:MAG: hypothetical protein EAZ36_02575 [Verrucomicrobiota bacterium]
MHGADMNPPRLISSCLLVFLIACAGGCISPKKRKPEDVRVARFLLEAGPNEFGATVRLPKSGTIITVSPKSYFSEYDIMKCDVIDNELGKSLVFEFTPQASRDLYRLTASNQGRRIVTSVNGAPIGARRIEAPISNGYIVTYVELDAEKLITMAKNITETSAEARKELEKKEK